MDSLPTDIFLLVTQSVEVSDLKSLCCSAKYLQETLNKRRVLDCLIVYHCILFEVTTFQEFVEAHTNKYDPLHSKLSWRTLKKNILNTNDREAFEIHYNAMTRSRKKWFPEAVTVFLDSLKEVDTSLYLVCTQRYGPNNVQPNNISYACLFYEPTIVNRCVYDWMEEVSLGEYRCWEDLMTDICKEYCRGMLVKGEVNIICLLHSFIVDVSPELSISLNEFEEKFTKSELPKLIM